MLQRGVAGGRKEEEGEVAEGRAVGRAVEVGGAG